LRLIQIRIDPALKARVDASDVAQDAQIAIADGIDNFLEKRPTSFRIWIRRKVLDQLIAQRRRHIGAMKRSVLKEQNMSNVSSFAIARKLLTNTPSQILGRIELQEQVYGLMEQLSEKNREVLVLRHAEELSNAEVAEVLEITPGLARKRYGRALLKLHELFAAHGIGADGLKE
jgi:RNA polymerase sigma-70 factor (ECF subfamily)